jgi:hypothetical protein
MSKSGRHTRQRLSSGPRVQFAMPFVFDALYCLAAAVLEVEVDQLHVGDITPKCNYNVCPQDLGTEGYRGLRRSSCW